MRMRTLTIPLIIAITSFAVATHAHAATGSQKTLAGGGELATDEEADDSWHASANPQWAPFLKPIYDYYPGGTITSWETPTDNVYTEIHYNPSPWIHTWQYGINVGPETNPPGPSHFTVPSNATITEITATVHCWDGNDRINLTDFVLTGPHDETPWAILTEMSQVNQTWEDTVTHTWNATDISNYDITPTIVNSENFGVSIRGEIDGHSHPSSIGHVEYIELEVKWTTP